VSVPHEAANEVRTHPSQADHSELRHRGNPTGHRPLTTVRLR
jgi:hypothetical protein